MALYQRFACWQKRGVWSGVFEELAKKSDFEEVFIDSTVIGVHRHRSVHQKNSAQSISRSRGGLTIKLHARVDGLENPVRRLLSVGNAHDVTQAGPLLVDL